MDLINAQLIRSDSRVIRKVQKKNKMKGQN